MERQPNTGVDQRVGRAARREEECREAWAVKEACRAVREEA